MSESDSDAPEEFTLEQGVQLDEELRKVQKESKARVVREGKERRRLWAQKKTPKPKNDNITKDVVETETQEVQAETDMLPSNIVAMLAAREKKVFHSDSEDEKTEEKSSKRKKKNKSSGSGPVMLNEIPPPPCLQSSLEFLKKRKMQAQRSSTVLNNSSQALRLVTSTVVLSKN